MKILRLRVHAFNISIIIMTPDCSMKREKPKPCKKNLPERRKEPTSSVQISPRIRNPWTASALAAAPFLLSKTQSWSAIGVFSFLIFRGEAVPYCPLKQAGTHLIPPPGAVAADSVSTVRMCNPRLRSPLLSDNEAVVSDDIELSLDSPGPLYFDKTVTLVIPLCAKSFLNSYRHSWTLEKNQGPWDTKVR